MKACVVVFVLICLFSGNAPAQIHSAALDSNCYFPQIDDPTEMDSIHGFSNGQFLGEQIHNFGLRPNGKLGDIFIGGLGPSAVPRGEISQDVAITGAGFDIHHLTAHALDLPGFNGVYKRGHFRDSKHFDLICESPRAYKRIYWEDDNGNFDSLHFTDLKLVGNSEHLDGQFSYYVASLTTDTVDDIVCKMVEGFDDQTRDTFFLALYRGGSNISGHTIVGPDTIIVLRLHEKDNSELEREFSQGDYRGTGRQDLIISDSKNNLYFYANDRPFDIGRIGQAMYEDTLLASWQNPAIYTSTTFGNNIGYNMMSMRALPKADGDRSVDFLPLIAEGNSSSYTIFIFGGGPDFGKRRLLVDSPSYRIRPPYAFDFQFGPMSGGITNCGDMTGTGRNVICWTGGGQHFGTEFYYVTGDALDEKADMYTSGVEYSSFPDTLTANGDRLEDILKGRPNQITQEEHDKGWFNVGTLELIYGSSRIPVHLNPQFSRIADHTGEIRSLQLWPNPASGHVVVQLYWPHAESGGYQVRDVLGREVESGIVKLVGGGQQIRLNFDSLPAGAYRLMIMGSDHSARAQFVIER